MNADKKPASKNRMIGRKIGSYEIIGFLAKGGMGSLFRARHIILNRACVIKTIHPRAKADPMVMRRFLREIRLGAMLMHPNIILFYDAGILNDFCYLVMEYFPGLDLHKRYYMRPTSPATIAHIGIQVAGALAAAHDDNIIHRDIKPKNILFDDTGVAKVCDFGLGKAMANEEFSRITSTGTLMGSPAFIAPETMDGVDAAGEYSDIYGLGAVLYFCATGQAPYDGVNAVEILQKVGSPIAAPRDLRPSIPIWLEDIILKAMSKDPAARYQSAREMQNVLNQAPREAADVVSTKKDRANRETLIIRQPDEERSPHLRVFSTIQGAQEYSITSGEMLVGRAEECDIPLTYETMSRHHAILRQTKEGLQLEDAGSRGGVFIHGERITGPRLLRHGDDFAMSCYTIEYREDPSPTDALPEDECDTGEMTYSPMPAGLRMRYRAIIDAPGGLFTNDDRIGGEHSGILIPLTEAIQDVQCVEIELTWPSDETFFCVGEFRGILFHTELPIMRLALHHLKPDVQKEISTFCRLGEWITAQHM